MKRFLAVTLCLIMCFLTFNSLAATKGEENALKKAQNYLSITNYSYKGLCEQLAFVGFSDSECKYAADHCGADWYVQAAEKALNYMSIMSFSKAGLVEQLEFVGFTKEEAEYGAAVAYEENPTKPGSIANGVLQETTPEIETVESSATETGTKETITVGKGFDVSSLSYDDLLSLRQTVINELMARPEWKEVEVPAGVWIIGQDIPAGYYSITPKGYVTFKFYENTETTYWDYYSLGSGEGLGKFELKDGMKIDISGPVIFAPPKGLGF